MRIEIQHPVFGLITYESGPKKKVTVEKGNLAERITWTMEHLAQFGAGEDYYPSQFLRACELLGIGGGELDVSVKRQGEHDLPEGATF